MNGKKRGLIGFLLLCVLSVHAGKSYKYRVQLTDKAETTYSINSPEDFLSARSLMRRVRQGLAVDSTDLPVCASYISHLEKQGGKFLSASKWNNTVLMQTPDEQTAERFLENKFVKSVKKVWVEPDTVFPLRKNREDEVTNRWKKQKDFLWAGCATDKNASWRQSSSGGFPWAGNTDCSN